MADSKLTALAEVSVPALEDLLYLVDDPGGVPVSVKISATRFLGLLNGICNGRLTTESGVPVSTADRTAQSTIYWTPFQGNRVALYDGTRWRLYSFSELSLALSGLTSGKNYDVFLYDNAGTLTLELSAAWTNDTTRADALALQDGVYVKSGATTRRYLGTLRTTATTTTEDSEAKRFLWNAYNRVQRDLAAPLETANTWTYTTATWRQANANTANKVEWVVGLQYEQVTVHVTAGAKNSNAFVDYAVGVGVDSTSADSSVHRTGVIGPTDTYNVRDAHWHGYAGIGYHYAAWLEQSGAVGTATWIGDGGSPTYYQSGIHGEVFC